MFRKPTVWIALFAVPLLYELARSTPQPWPLALLGVLHWGLAAAVLGATESGENGTLGGNGEMVRPEPHQPFPERTLRTNRVGKPVGDRANVSRKLK